MKSFATTFIVLLFLLLPGGAEAQQLDQVYVINQGAFLQGNSSVTAFTPASGETSQNVFQQTNGRPLGDVAVHSVLINDLLYVLVSNSDKIEIVNPETFEEVETLFVDDFGGSGPQWIEPVGESKAYISNLTGSTVSILELPGNQITGAVEVGANPEGIAVSNGKAYIALTAFGDGTQLAVVDTETDTLLDHIEVHDNPRFVYADDNGFIWVMSTGNFGFGDMPESFGKLTVIDPSDDSIVGEIEIGGKPQALQLNNADRIAYVLNDGIQRVDMDTRVLLDDLSETAYFNIGFWEGDEPALYATFAPDFSSSGSVDILNLQGDVTASFTAGIGPGHVQFIGSGDPVSTEPSQTVEGFALKQNYPNPFNPTTTITYTLPEAATVRLEVFTVSGQRVALLRTGHQSAGTHNIRFDGSALAGGVYYYRLTTPEARFTRGMTLVK